MKKVIFLDRDGVINKRLVDDYVTKLEDFEFLPGVLDAIAKLNNIFDRVFIVTNQQGVGKGLMSEKDLKKIHDFMLSKIEAHGGKVDAVFCCPHLPSDGCSCRKPKDGMYLQALKAVPEIKGALLYMVGDTPSDMEFAKNIGAVAVMISYKSKSSELNYKFVFSSLKQFVKDIHLVLV